MFYGDISETLLLLDLHTHTWHMNPGPSHYTHQCDTMFKWKWENLLLELRFTALVLVAKTLWGPTIIWDQCNVAEQKSPVFLNCLLHEPVRCQEFSYTARFRQLLVTGDSSVSDETWIRETWSMVELSTCWLNYILAGENIMNIVRKWSIFYYNIARSKSKIIKCVSRYYVQIQ